MKYRCWRMFSILALMGIYCSTPGQAAAKTDYENNIAYLGADWGPNGDTVYFLKQIMSKKRTTGGLANLFGGVENLGSHIWLCKMKWDGTEKQEIAELWVGKGPYVDTQNGPVWMEVNAATSNAVFSIEFGMGTVSIWLIGLDGKNLHKPFELPWNEKEKIRGLHASWSPDGTKLVYSEQAETMRIVVYDLVKKVRRQLTDGPRDDHPVWSPIGDWIAYKHCLRGEDRRIWLIKPDGSEAKPVMNAKNEPIWGWWPSWNPEGTRVSVAGSALWLADIATNKTEWIDPLLILGEWTPSTLMGHHWGKRGWLLSSSRSVRLVRSAELPGRLLAVGGIYDSTSKDLQWGLPAQDIPRNSRP